MVVGNELECGVIKVRVNSCKYYLGMGTDSDMCYWMFHNPKNIIWVSNLDYTAMKILDYVCIGKYNFPQHSLGI